MKDEDVKRLFKERQHQEFCQYEALLRIATALERIAHAEEKKIK
jgi:hypothetical protein